MKKFALQVKNATVKIGESQKHVGVKCVEYDGKVIIVQDPYFGLKNKKATELNVSENHACNNLIGKRLYIEIDMASNKIDCTIAEAYMISPAIRSENGETFNALMVFESEAAGRFLVISSPDIIGYFESNCVEGHQFVLKHTFHYSSIDNVYSDFCMRESKERMVNEVQV